MLAAAVTAKVGDTNTNITDVQWIQASLPVKNGGLKVRRVSSLAPSSKRTPLKRHEETEQ